MALVEGQDALSAARPSATLCPQPNTDIIMHGTESQARLEIATTLNNLVNTLNTYITRKGL